MKKMIAVIAALAMLFVCALPAAAETVTVDEALLGTWVMDEIGAEFTFNLDGTYDEVLGDIVGNGKYHTADGHLYIDGEGPIDYLIDGDQMIFSDSGMDLTFTRKSAAGGPLDAEALLGTWNLTGTDIGLSVDLKLVFNEDGTYVMSGAGQESTGTYTLEESGIRFDDQEPEAAVLDGDTLTIEETGVTLTFTREGADIETLGTADAEALVGSWVLEGDSGFIVTFGSDGTLNYSSGGQEIQTVYTVTGNVLTTAEGEELRFSIYEDRLSLTESGVTLNFIRK